MKKTIACFSILSCCVVLTACVPPGTLSRQGAAPVSNAAKSGQAGQSRQSDQAGQSGQSAEAEPDPAEYRLGPGDTVKITVYNNPDLTTESELSQSGKISFPLVGEIMLGGLSRGQAEREVSKRLGSGGFVPNAYVNLLVTQYRSRQIAVMGEVNKPGTYSISKPTSIAEMLAMAGGIGPKGSDQVTLIRRDASGNAQRYEINVRKLLASGDLSTNALVDKDDIIFVPAMAVFYIYGEVRQPGSYPLVPDMTVRQALAQGGGLTVRGTERGIRLERKGKGSETITRRPHPDDKLQANDVLYVPESWF